MNLLFLQSSCKGKIYKLVTYDVMTCIWPGAGVKRRVRPVDRPPLAAAAAAAASLGTAPRRRRLLLPPLYPHNVLRPEVAVAVPEAAGPPPAPRVDQSHQEDDGEDEAADGDPDDGAHGDGIGDGESDDSA